MDKLIVTSLLKQMLTQNNQSVYEISTKKRVMLVFLRHFGCFFCRETLDELSKFFEELSKNNTQLIFVHMSENQVAEQYFVKYGLNDIQHVSDKECYYYNMFKLGKATTKQLLNLQSFIRGFDSAFIKGRGGALPNEKTGDEYQMPGIFIIDNGLITNQFIHKTPSDKPDYNNLIKSQF
ncbi:MAG: redoxin domain-containing protein [Saprospiraceae bacterium]|jgi:peroxiredoxin|nr:redoxin domain-containing protein [Saprospiraceae bacterium]